VAYQEFIMHTLADIILRNEECRGNKEAFVCGDRRENWGGYASRARYLSSALYKAGLRRQDRASIVAMNCLEYYELYAACSLAGFIVAPVNFRLAAPEIHYILNDSSPRVLFFEARYADIIASLRAETPSVELLICIGGPTPDWAVDFEQFLASGSSDGAPVSARPDDVPYLLYTSGTTGRPKGVIHTHKGICAASEMTALASQFTVDSRLLQTSPAYHSGGTIYVNSTAWMGGSIIIHQEFEPTAVLNAIDSEKISHTFMVPTMLQAVMDCEALESCDTSSIKIIHSAGAPISVPLLRKALTHFGKVFALQYGSTETYSVCSMPPSQVQAEGNADTIGRLASIGQTISGVGLRIVDENGDDRPIGEPGELWVRSDSNLIAYWNNHVATLEGITDGWYHTGDIGYFDKDKYVFLVDRKKDMIVSGGENIYSREVENALHEHEAIIEAAVIGVPDKKWGESVRAVIVKIEDEELDEEAAIAHCKLLIAGYKCPKSVIFVDALPRISTGKIDKGALRKSYSNRFSG
jgi:acyl-CoA synthetase (AMP-forming)/AMP-acid ligase II